MYTTYSLLIRNKIGNQSG